ncbi:hypothetical protein N9Q08_05735, partial [Schleiferiaceae bacterium]|nr:hypothetical protein [Schleiferiaceae bacterium]
MAKIINKSVGVFLAILLTIAHHWRSIFDSREKVVNVIFWPQTLRDFIEYVVHGYLLQDYVLLRALHESGFKTRTVPRYRIERLPKNSIVCYSMTKCTTAIKSDSRMSQGESLFLELSEIQDYQFFPKVDEARIWENKEYMHRIFDEIGVRTPRTLLVSSIEQLLEVDVNYPVLSKAPNSNQSKGIDLHRNYDSLKGAVQKKLNESKVVILQEYIEIQFDIRVVVISGKVVYHYWRHKQHANSNRFMTTSTSNGGKIDIKVLPPAVVQECLVAADKLELSMAAF